MCETILHMHVVTSRGSKKRNAIYWVKNFDDIGKVFTADRLDDFKYKIIKAYIQLPLRFVIPFCLNHIMARSSIDWIRYKKKKEEKLEYDALRLAKIL